MEWTKKLENVAKKIGEDSKFYKLMHTFQARKYHIIYNALSITSIILGPIASLLSGIEVALYPNEHPTFPILVSVVSAFSGIIAAAVKFGNYDIKSQSNKTIATRYTSIENNVRRQLSVDEKDRVPASEYLGWLESKYEELQLSAPMIQPVVYNRFRENVEPVNPTGERRLQITEEKVETKTNDLKAKKTSDCIINIDDCSDKMLKYELARLKGFSDK